MCCFSVLGSHRYWFGLLWFVSPHVILLLQLSRLDALVRVPTTYCSSACPVALRHRLQMPGTSDGIVEDVPWVIYLQSDVSLVSQSKFERREVVKNVLYWRSWAKCHQVIMQIWSAARRIDWGQEQRRKWCDKLYYGASGAKFEQYTSDASYSSP